MLKFIKSTKINVDKFGSTNIIVYLCTHKGKQ